MRDINNNLIAAIDIGSSKIVTIIAEVSETANHINILGYGVAPTQNGIKDGAIQNIESVVSALQKSTETAEIQADRRSYHSGRRNAGRSLSVHSGCFG